MTDLRSKNGIFLDGERVRSLCLRPGKVFALGAWPHRLLALNDPMHLSLPALLDILGTEAELRNAPEARSPSDVIVAAAAGSPLLIASEPHCEQENLARIVRKMSLLRDRPIIELAAKDVPQDASVQHQLIKERLGRSTLVLDLADHEEPLPPMLLSALFRPRNRVRVIALARRLEDADRVLGRHYSGQLQQIALRPLARRGDAIDRLFDRMLEERGSPLRMSYLTHDNQEALRRYGWPENFQSLRQAAATLTAIFRLGSIHKAAHTLNVSSSTLHLWYHGSLRLSAPLSNRLIGMDKEQ